MISSEMKTIGIIPARYASTRFPGKPLARIGGISMIQRVYQQAVQAESLSAVVVATDDERIFDHVTNFGGRVVMTSPDHPSGTDRCAEAARLTLNGHSPAIVVNIQGDEPFIDPAQIDELYALFEFPDTAIATLARPITDEENIINPNIVKVLFAPDGRALYFSRQAIPYLRDVPPGRWAAQGLHHQHLGLYAYRYDVLEEITRLSPGRFERAESLEQLRWLEAGYTIRVAITQQPTIGIDTPEDLERAEQWLSNL
jgi:3-deoxy-manno-octulosonate cytidylyltransferase (CMP-KDO synthetase)